ncbi:unnamed protein product [Lota lota]
MTLHPAQIAHAGAIFPFPGSPRSVSPHLRAGVMTGGLAEDLMNMDVAAPSAPSPGLAECKHTTTTRLGCARTTLIQRPHRPNTATAHPVPDLSQRNGSRSPNTPSLQLAELQTWVMEVEDVPC